MAVRGAMDSARTPATAVDIIALRFFIVFLPWRHAAEAAEFYVSAVALDWLHVRHRTDQPDQLSVKPLVYNVMIGKAKVQSFNSINSIGIT
jgi:hypothetical protein